MDFALSAAARRGMLGCKAVAPKQGKAMLGHGLAHEFMDDRQH